MSRWKILSGVSLYFITTTIVEWQNVFTAIPFFETIIESLKHCIAHKCLHLHGYAIMPSHAHYIVSTEPPEYLSDVMDFNRFTSQRITEIPEEAQRTDMLTVFRTAANEEGRGNRYKVWQEGFHPIAIDTADFFLEKLNYLHENPVRKGFIEQPEQWRYFPHPFMSGIPYSGTIARNYLLDDYSVIQVECLE
jgi:putative transposase